MLCRLFIALLIFLIPVNCFAFIVKPDGFQHHVTLGQNVTCGKWHEDRKSEHSHAYEWFVVGYLSAFNAYVPGIEDIAGGKDMKSIFLWIDKYCETYPFKTLDLAVHDLGREIHPYEKRKKSGYEDLGNLVD